jgi:hypothetical protein
MIAGQVTPMMGAFGDGMPGDENLDLHDAAMTSPAGRTLKVPVLRIQATAVSAWRATGTSPTRRRGAAPAEAPA